MPFFSLSMPGRTMGMEEDNSKVAHYAQFAYDKLRAELGESDVYAECRCELRPYEPGVD